MPAAGLRQTRNMLLLQTLSEILLVFATWQLWSNSGDFPAIPLLAVFTNVPSFVDRIITVLFLLSCVVTVISCRGNTSRVGEKPASGGRLRIWIGLATLLGGLLCLLNQHRLQPWHWLFLLLNFQFLTLKLENQKLSRRLTLASIYIFAGISRFGPGVDAGISREVLTLLLDTAGLSTLTRNHSVIFVASAGMTSAEVMTGILLLIPQFRKVGIAMSLGIHTLLLLALGPWGLGHNNAVLIWNVFFLLAIPVAFVDFCGKSEQCHSLFEAGQGRKNRFAVRMNVAVIAFPLSGLFGFADNWPSWQLYSPRPDVLRLYVTEATVRQLPENLQQYVGAPQPLQIWCPVRLDRWSLDATGAPMYPEDRFQLGVVAAVLPEDIGENAFRVIVEGAVPFEWWQRKTIEMTSARGLKKHCQAFFYNTDVRNE